MRVGAHLFLQSLHGQISVRGSSLELIAVSDLDRSLAFYHAVLKTVWATQIFAYDEAVGYGYEGGDDKLCLKPGRRMMSPGESSHVAFTATDANRVHEFHAAALRHGGRCNPAVGAWPELGAHEAQYFIESAQTINFSQSAKFVLSYLHFVTKTGLESLLVRFAKDGQDT